MASIARSRSDRRPVMSRKVVRNIFYTLALVVMLFPVVAFFYWMLLISLRSDLINNAYPPVFVPRSLTLNNYKQVLEENAILHDGLNSLIVAVGSTAIGMVLGVPAAYSIARWRQQRLALVILISRIIPAISFLVPWYILFSRAKLVDTYVALIVTHLIVALPLITWIMIGFFEDLPPELEESARIDGCSLYGAFMKIAVPLARPGIIAATIISFIFSWNNFIFSVVLAGSRTRTLPLAAYKLLNFSSFSYGGLTATAVLITLPIILLALAVQRYLVAGLTVGGVK
ncbi:MAG: carbohydrate ABC transporter permease [Chloroflexota bacterium]|nr:carbohydrate ABC transporter permease [Chloroflexota bacterium]MDQ6905358.1 carbohydrate ABC transporter permease [Chloroflexota bacterium]